MKYKFLKNHRYSLTGRDFKYNLKGDIVELPDSHGLKFIGKGVCEQVSEAEVEEKHLEPENKMLETEKETKEEKSTYKQILNKFKK